MDSESNYIHLSKPYSKASCSICRKDFRSTSTLESHCSSLRHRWKLEKCYREKMEKDKLFEIETNVCARPSNVNPATLRDEALTCIHKDTKRSALLLCKAGKGFVQNKQTEEARICLLKAIELASKSLKESKNSAAGENGNERKGRNGLVALDGNNNSSVDYDDGFCLERGNVQRGSRLKRQKMEQISKLCKSLPRGSVDLFQTMVQCYEESFDIKLGDEEGRKLGGERSSVKKTEILLNRDLVLKELADTERSYVDSLEYVVKTILPAFENCESDDLKEAYSGIFSNIKEIYEWHSRIFVDKIEDCLEDHELLGPTFKQHEDELSSLYETYCQNKPHADDLLADLAEEIDQVFQKLDTNFTILDYLIKPVQRVMKYQLLLHSILKYTKKMGDCLRSIQIAFDVMDLVPQRVNDKMHLAMIIGYPGDFEGQNLVFQDTLDVAVGRGKAKPKKYRIFIFEEVVLMTETIERIGRLPQYRYVFEGKTCRMGVTETVENHKLKFAIWFRKFSSSDIYVCTAETKELKERWIKTINGVLDKNSGDSSAGTSRREPSTPAYRLGKSLRTMKSNTWSPDQLVKQATIGHPREGAMSMKLKESIHKFLIEEIMLTEEEKIKDGNYDDDNLLQDNEFLEGLRNCNRRFNGDANFRNESLSEDSSKEDEINSGSNVNKEYSNNGHIYDETDEFDDDPFDRNKLSTVKEHPQTNETGALKLRRSVDDVRSRTLRIDQPDRSDKQSKITKEKNKRCSSVPSLMKFCEPNQIVEREQEKTTLTELEISLFARVLAESQFILAQVESDTSIEKATQLCDQSLSLFFDVQELKSIQNSDDNREDLLQKCTSLYQVLRSTDNFGQKESDLDESQSFYSYEGLSSLLTSYGDLSAKDITSSWCIVLYSLAVMSANIENKWDDSRTVFRKLGEIYKLQESYDNSVESFVDAHYIILETGDVISAAKDLADALKVALSSGDLAKCRRLEVMAMPLLHPSDEISKNFDVEMLQLLAEMSLARRAHDFDWYCKHYDRLCTCEESCQETQKSELNELFLHLLDHLIKKKQIKSGEVFV